MKIKRQKNLLLFLLGLTLVACCKDKENDIDNTNNENGAVSNIIESTGMPSFQYLGKYMGRTDLSAVKEQLSSDGWAYEWCANDQIEEATTNDSSYINVYVSQGEIIEIWYNKIYQSGNNMMDHIISIMTDELNYAKRNNLTMNHYSGYYDTGDESGESFTTKEDFIEALKRLSVNDFKHGKSKAKYTTCITQVDFRTSEGDFNIQYGIEAS